MGVLHSVFHYSITVHTTDQAIVNCLIGLAHHCQKTGVRHISYSGTSAEDWKQNGYRVTFRFTHPHYREDFKNHATRLLKSGSWSPVAENDNDPAIP